MRHVVQCGIIKQDHVLVRAPSPNMKPLLPSDAACTPGNIWTTFNKSTSPKSVGTFRITSASILSMLISALRSLVPALSAKTFTPSR